MWEVSFRVNGSLIFDFYRYYEQFFGPPKVSCSHKSVCFEDML